MAMVGFPLPPSPPSLTPDATTQSPAGQERQEREKTEREKERESERERDREREKE